MRRTALLASAALLTALVATDLDLSPRPADAAPASLRDVMFVGNNWAGTATIVDANTRQVLKTGVNFIPDKKAELQDQDAVDRALLRSNDGTLGEVHEPLAWALGLVQ